MHQISPWYGFRDHYLKKQILFGSVLLFTIRGHMTETLNVASQNHLSSFCSSQGSLPLWSLEHASLYLESIGGTQCSSKKNGTVRYQNRIRKQSFLFIMCEKDSSTQKQCVMCGARVKFQAHLVLCIRCLVKADNFDLRGQTIAFTHRLSFSK